MKMLSVLSLLMTTPALGQASFLGLGDLDGGDFYSYAYGVSADGAVVVGMTHSAEGEEAFRWTQNDGMVGLGDLDGGGLLSYAYDTSADGAVIVGASASSNGASEAFRWTSADGLVGLGDLDGGDFYSSAIDVSDDGAVVVGFAEGDTGTVSFRWTDGTMSPLGHLDGGANGSGVGISGDGSAVVGWSESLEGLQAFRWTENGGMIGLGDLPGGTFYSVATDISASGLVVVGHSRSEASGNNLEAFAWTEAGGMVALGDLPQGDYHSSANATSADGSIVVGTSRIGEGVESSRAFIWDQLHGMRDLNTVLPALGADLDGWTLRYARGVSADGTVIVGYGNDPEGNIQGWIAHLTTPCYPDLDGSVALDLFDFLAYVNLFNAEDPIADCTADGAFDLFDFLCFVNAFNAGC